MRVISTYFLAWRIHFYSQLLTITLTLQPATATFTYKISETCICHHDQNDTEFHAIAKNIWLQG